MSLSLITLLIVAVICLLLGGIAGVLFSSMAGPQEEEGESVEKEAPPGGRRGGYTRLASLWREKNTGALVVEVDEKAFLTPDPLTVEQRERLASAAGDFAQWIGAPAPAPAPGRASQAAQAAPEHVEPPPAAPSGAAQPLSRPAPPPAVLPTTPIPAPGRVVPPLKEEPKSMVEQINAVLAELIAGTPYEARGLALTEDPVNGVIVWVGSASYAGVDSVPDREIQNVIRSAVAEWERREDAARRQRS